MSNKAIDQLHSPGENFLVQFQHIFVTVTSKSRPNPRAAAWPNANDEILTTFKTAWSLLSLDAETAEAVGKACKYYK